MMFKNRSQSGRPNHPDCVFRLGKRRGAAGIRAAGWTFDGDY
jgi:hypothetical protein